MKNYVALVALSLACAGCVDDAYDVRYQAERLEYWAERRDVIFSLESTPEVRRGYYESGLRHLEVAQRADPERLAATAPTDVRNDLAQIHGRALVRAGSAFLSAGRLDLAEDRLAEAQGKAPHPFDQQAAWLRGTAAEEREDWDAALRHYREFFTLGLGESEGDPPTEEMLQLAPALAERLFEVEQLELLAEWRTWGRDMLLRVAQRWPETFAARRALFLRHRIATAAEDWDTALADLQTFETQSEDAADIDRARFNRAQILAERLGRPRESRALYEGLAQGSADPRLPGLAALRLAELDFEAGKVERALGELNRLSESKSLEVASEALFRRAKILDSLGRWPEAVEHYRRLMVSFRDSPPALSAPLAIVAVYEREGSPARVLQSLEEAVTTYRGVLASYPGDSAFGVEARNNLVTCLRQLDRPRDALLELERLYQARGGFRDGEEALLEAARVAHEELGDPDLARGYLERIMEEYSGGASARRAAAALALLEAEAGTR